MDYFKLYKLMENDPVTPADGEPPMTQQKPAMLPNEEDPSIVVRSAAQAYKTAMDQMRDEIRAVVADASQKLAAAGEYTAGPLKHADLPQDHKGTPQAVTGKSLEKIDPIGGGEGGDAKVQSMVSAFEKWKQQRRAAGGK